MTVEPSSFLWSLQLNGADQLAILFFQVEYAGARAERTQYIQQGSAGRIEPEGIEDQA